MNNHIEITIRVGEGVETLRLKAAGASRGALSIWWERASARDRALFAKLAADRFGGDACRAWDQLDGTSWMSEYRKTAAAEHNPLLLAIQTRIGADEADDNAIDVETEDPIEDYAPPVQRGDTPTAVLEDLDEDLI